MFDGDVPHHEQELAQFKGIALVVPSVATLCTFLRAFRFWLRSRVLVLVHSVLIIRAGIRRVGNGSVLLPKGPLGEVPDDSVAELVRFLCQGVDRIDRLFSHPKPVGRTGGVLDCLLQPTENHVVHREALVLIHE